MLYLKTLAFGTVVFLAGLGVSRVTGLAIGTDVLEVFLGLFGAFYAIIIGFVIFIAMEGYHRVRELISAEVNALQDVRDHLELVDADPEDPTNDNEQVVLAIRERLRVYVEQVVREEWPIMASARKMPADFRDTPASVIALMRTVNRIKCTNHSDEVALEQIVETVAAITTHRTNRLSAASTRLPGALRHLVLWISLLAVCVFALVDIEPATVKWLLHGINVFSVTFIYFIVMDLDDPFRGAWSLDARDYEDLLGRLGGPSA